MKFSDKQLEVLSEIWDCRDHMIADDSCTGMRKTINWLYKNDYISIFTYANGDHYGLTNKALDAIDTILKERKLI